jgi:A-macroglobulin receptor binding domain
MSRGWLLFPLCLSLAFLVLVPITSARGGLSVNEAATEFLLREQESRVSLVIENRSGTALSVQLQLELIDPQGAVVMKADREARILPGSHAIALELPFRLANLNALVIQALARSSASPDQQPTAKSELTPAPDPTPATAANGRPLNLPAASPGPDGQTVVARALKEQLVRKGLLFLLRQKDRYGVWYSTQTTINVLDALLALLPSDSARSVPPANPARAAAAIIVNGRAARTVALPEASELSGPVLIDLSPLLRIGENRIQIERSGSSEAASAQVVANFYVPWSNGSAASSIAGIKSQHSGLRLVTNFDRTTARVGEEIVCHVEAERIGFRGYGMLMAEIGLPPGANVDRESLEKMVKESGWAISQYDVLPDRVLFYLWPPAGGSRFDFKFKLRFPVKAKSAPSLLYDYYNPEAQTVQASVQFLVR